jgi:Ca2+-binding EF-hand superfamily protein
VFGEVLGRIAGVYIGRKTRKAEHKFLHRSITLCDLRRMDANDDGMVDMEEFITFMLVALQKVDKESIDDLRAIFRSLDTNGNGMLEKDDLVEIVQKSNIQEQQTELA